MSETQQPVELWRAHGFFKTDYYLRAGAFREQLPGYQGFDEEARKLAAELHPEWADVLREIPIRRMSGMG